MVVHRSYLGILFDKQLTFTDHITHMIARARRMLRFLISNGRNFSEI